MQNQVAAGTQGLLQVQQPSASGGGAATSTPQHFQTNTSSQVPQQQLLMASQQQGIRIVAGSQGQPLKIMTQPGVQATIPVLQGNKLQTVQVLQQQAAGIKGPDSASQNSNIGIPNVSVKASAPQVKFVSQPQMIQQQFTTNTTQIGSQPLMQTQVQRGSSSLPSANLATVHNSPMNFLGLSTATSTVVTSTVTSTLAMTTGASVVNGSPQIVSTGLQVSSQATAQAKKSAPILPQFPASVVSRITETTSCCSNGDCENSPDKRAAVSGNQEAVAGIVGYEAGDNGAGAGRVGKSTTDSTHSDCATNATQ